MKLLIDIPKEFEQHFQADRFEDSLHRLSADAHLLAGLYEQETAVMLIEAFATSVPVPEHGRLIDADALMAANERSYDAFLKNGELTFHEASVAFLWASEEIRRAPTIIPAEEGEG